jgi:hypothetical protein
MNTKTKKLEFLFFTLIILLIYLFALTVSIESKTNPEVKIKPILSASGETEGMLIFISKYYFLFKEGLRSGDKMVYCNGKLFSTEAMTKCYNSQYMNVIVKRGNRLLFFYIKNSE